MPTRPRVLLIRPDHLGDVLMSSPTVELLRKALPEAHLAMMVGPWAAEVAQRDPLLDEVQLCPFPGFTRAFKGFPLAPYRTLWRTARELKRGRYDVALVLRFDHWWGAWLSALAGIPVRLGYGVAECSPFLTHALEPPQRLHWVEQGLALAERLVKMWGAPELEVTAPPGLRFHLKVEDEGEASLLWCNLKLEPGHPVVALHPGAGSPLKLWAMDRWVALGEILSRAGAQVVITGSGDEIDAAEQIAAGIAGSRSLAGRTSLGVLAALYRRCNLVVGVDNGPLHLAVAMGIPTVHLFGPTDPAIFGPWGDRSRHRVVASAQTGAPCSRLDLEPPWGELAPCMRAIPVERVAEASLEAMKGS